MTEIDYEDHYEPAPPADRYQLAWRNARARARVLSAELTRRAPLLGEYAEENTKLHQWHDEDRDALTEMRATIERLRGERRELGELAARRESELIHYRSQQPAAAPSAPVDADLRTLIRGVIRDCPALYPDDIADRVWAALQSAYRRLLARLEADRAVHLRAAGQATEAGEAELVTVSSTFASAFRHAAVMVVAELEGSDAAEAYMQRTEGGEEGVPADDDLRDRIAEALVFAARVVATSGPGAANAVQAVIDRVQKALAVLPEARRPFDAQAGLQRLTDSPAPGEMYRHYKGGLYTVLAVAEDTGTGAPVVVYRDEERRVWTRPLVEFAGTVADGARRFTLEGELAALSAPADRAAVALAEVRRLCEMTIEGSVRVDAIHQARDTLAVIDRRMADEAGQAAGCSSSPESISPEFKDAVGTLNSSADERADRVLDERVAAAKEQQVGLPPQLQAALDVMAKRGRVVELTAGRENSGVVAYRNSDRPGVLLCREHGDGWMGLTPLTPDGLPDGGLCTECGVDVLIPQQAGEGR